MHIALTLMHALCLDDAGQVSAGQQMVKASSYSRHHVYIKAYKVLSTATGDTRDLPHTLRLQYRCPIEASRASQAQVCGAGRSGQDERRQD